MPKFKYLIKFDRKNPQTDILEKNSERFGEFGADNRNEAEKHILAQFAKNEPTATRIREYSITLIPDGPTEAAPEAKTQEALPPPAAPTTPHSAPAPQAKKAPKAKGTVPQPKNKKKAR